MLAAWEKSLLDDHAEQAAAVLQQRDALSSLWWDPLRADADLQAFIEADGRPAACLRQFIADPKALELLLHLGQVSRYAFDVVRQYPRVFWQVMQERQYRHEWARDALVDGLRNELDAISEWRERTEALAQFKHRHWVRILLGELTGDFSFTQIVAQISHVIDALAEAALQLAVDALQPRFGTIVPEGHPLYPGFLVLGMGKLGGRELNYSSDIDLIFVYDLPEDASNQSSWRGEIDHHEYAKRLGKEVISLLENPGHGAMLLRVDMRLRPEGDRGELALSRRETVDYYYSVGRPWERQALIKARRIAGSKSLAASLEEALAPWVYPRDPAWEDLQESRSMRRRIEERSREADVKTGAGGIRDIEFMVQGYQLAEGGRQVDLRRRDTLPTLRLLAERGLLPRREAHILDGHYRWLRQVEHRIQVWEDRQLHEIPADDAEQSQLAGRCGYRGAQALADFQQDHRLIRREVRVIVSKHFLDDTRDDDGLRALLVQGELDPTLAEQALAAGHFTDAAAAARRLRVMAVEPFFVLSRARTERALAALLPVLLHLIGETPEPDQTLANLERIIEAVGGRATFFELLANRPDVLRLFTDLAGWSSYLVELFHSYPGLPDDVMDTLNQSRQSSVHLRIEARSIAQGLADPSEPLAHLMAREQAVIALRDLHRTPGEDLMRAVLDPIARVTRRLQRRGRLVDDNQIGEALTTVCEAVVDTLLMHLARVQAQAWGLPRDRDGRPTRFAILALGKLGGRELGYASDLDIIFLCDPDGTCERADRDGVEFWTVVAQGLMRTLQERRMMELDARLRPWGDGGELVPTTTALQRYWSEPKDLWERMAMLRCAHLAGDPRLSAEGIAIIHGGAMGAPLPADAIQQVRSMRARLEQSVAGRDHVKRGWGGYVDVEFITQYHCLGLPASDLPMPASTTACVRHLGAAGRIPSAAVPELVADVNFLRFVEGRMRLSAGKAISSLPTEASAREQLARRCHLEDRAALDLALHLARERSRRWFDTLISGDAR